MAISMLKIRRPLGRLIFNMGIAIPGKTVFLIETAPWRQNILALWDVNTMLVDALAPEVTRASAGIIAVYVLLLQSWFHPLALDQAKS